jgi:hypothetical protein
MIESDSGGLSKEKTFAKRQGGSGASTLPDTHMMPPTHTNALLQQSTKQCVPQLIIQRALHGHAISDPNSFDPKEGQISKSHTPASTIDASTHFDSQVSQVFSNCKSQ